MLRKLALSLAIAGALGTSNANALGLGEIRITSALNEPLQAEIQLLQMRSVDPQQILPRMANVDEFALAGLEKLRFLSDVKFEVKPGPSGQGTIILTSSAPVKEPFLNFLVEVNWPSGRLVREYTVLLDPPIYDPTPAPVAVQPARSSAASAPASVAVKPMAPQAPVDNIRTRMTDGQVYVDVNDTLWVIAKKHKPSSSVSEAQMMLALQRKNPDAFRNNNVNQLKAGVVMTLPSLEEVEALDRKQANEEFWRQTQMWKQGVAPVSQPTPVDASGGADDTDKEVAAGKKGEEVAARSAQGQLKIVSPDTKAEASTVSDQAADADVSLADTALLEKNTKLEADLASAQESVDQIQRENAELSGRVDALAQQMETLQRMLELKDQQLADLQAELESAKKQPVVSQVVPVAEPKPKSLLEEFGLYIGAAGGAILAFLLALLLMRRGKKENSSEAVVPGQAMDTAAPQDKDAAVIPAVAAAAAVVATQADESVAEEADLDELDLDLDMDLDKVEDVAEFQDIDEQEFDLGFDEDFGEPPAATSMDVDEEVDDALDSILGEDTESFDLDDLTAQADIGDLGPLPEELVFEEPEVDSLEELFAAEDAAAEDTDLEFDIQPMADINEGAQEGDDLDDDLDFNLDVADTEIDDIDEQDSLDLMMDEPAADEDNSLDLMMDEPAADEEDSLDLMMDEPAADEEDSLDLMMGEPSADEDDSLDLMMDEPAADEDDSLDLMMDESVADEEEDFADLDSLLGEEESATIAEEESSDAELDALLAGVGEADVEELDLADSDADLDLDLDLDADLQSLLDADDEIVLDEEEFAAPQADNDSPLTHDLDAELDSELEMLLNDAGSDELSLDMTDDAEDDSLDGLNLLEGADEVETKLDLARAYIDMEDLDGAKDILQEIVKEGSEAQRSEANSLLGTIS